MSPPDAHPSRTDAALRVIRLRRAQRALDGLFRSLPLGRRVRTGIFMAFKTVLSALVAYAIGHALHTEQAFWAAISAVAVTQPHFGDTRGARAATAAWERSSVASPACWACRSAAAATCFRSDLRWGWSRMACWTANAGPAARIGGITTAIVLLVPSQGPRWEVPLYRLGEVILGTLCALAIGWLVSRLEERAERKQETEAP